MPLEGRNVLWLYGVAGSGKSTIATPVADYFHEIRHLGAFIEPSSFSMEMTKLTVTLLLSYTPWLINWRHSTLASSLRFPQKLKMDKSNAEAPIRWQFANLLLGPLKFIAEQTMQSPVIV
jgi:hypothetical protein